jgi:hypothetical protein
MHLVPSELHVVCEQVSLVVNWLHVSEHSQNPLDGVVPPQYQVQPVVRHRCSSLLYCSQTTLLLVLDPQQFLFHSHGLLGLFGHFCPLQTSSAKNMLQSLTEELVAASVVGEAVAAEVTAEDVTVEECADVTEADVTSEDVTAAEVTAEDVGDTEVPAEVLPGQEHLLFESTHFWLVPGQSRIGHSVGL